MEQVREGNAEADGAQKVVMDALQELHHQLLTPPIQKPSSLTKRLLNRNNQPGTSTAAYGLYIWGGVGRGKTWLMDIFYNSLPFAQKRRRHFHSFMRQIHSELAALKGRRDPLDIVAANFAQEAKVLCLDEFHVSDIGDAMLLGQLLKGLFNQGVVLVATSNTPPDHLYQDGLQRMSFLPTIALLKEKTQVIELSGSTDYRLKYLEHAQVYHTPLNQDSGKMLESKFTRLTTNQNTVSGYIQVEGREIPVISKADDVIWLDFDILCGGPRSSADYIQIARCYHTLLLSDIPVMNDDHVDRLRRFMHLVDELYDRNVKLIVSAEAPPRDLYAGRRLAFEFQRTASRLQEMQSRNYLAKGHRSS